MEAHRNLVPLAKAKSRWLRFPLRNGPTSRSFYAERLRLVSSQPAKILSFLGQYTSADAWSLTINDKPQHTLLRMTPLSRLTRSIAWWVWPLCQQTAGPSKPALSRDSATASEYTDSKGQRENGASEGWERSGLEQDSHHISGACVMSRHPFPAQRSPGRENSALRLNSIPKAD